MIGSWSIQLRQLQEAFALQAYTQRVEYLLWASLSCGLVVVLWQSITSARVWLAHGNPDLAYRGRVIRANRAWAVTGASTVCLSLLFCLSYATYLDAAVPPGDSYEIRALSDRGLWSFSYPNGKVSPAELVAPAARPIQLVLSSKNGMHDLTIPELGVHAVAIPGRYASVWFEAATPRRLRIACSEGCARTNLGASTASILEQSEFEMWLAQEQPNHLPALGK